jgi:cellulose synthase/poly-beta-1,6-N-acetylglucosamine synthase-like glycosyltransferase
MHSPTHQDESCVLVAAVGAFSSPDIPGGRRTAEGNGRLGGLLSQIILAYNTPEDLPVELEIRDLEQCYPNFTAIRVQGSTSKSDNVNGVMHKLKGEFVGIFDSDHVPMPGSFECAWRNLEQGFHFVQGRTKVNHRFADDWLGRGVAAEFEVRLDPPCPSPHGPPSRSSVDAGRSSP